MRFRRGWLAAPAIAAVFLLPTTASATPPTITSIEPAYAAFTVHWSLPSGMSSWSLEAATSPDTGPDGSFLAGNLAFSTLLGAGATSAYVGVPTGAYYVHVSAYGSCASPLLPSCTKEFSPTERAVAPGTPPTLNSLCLYEARVTARWSLPASMRNDFMEVATSPAVYDGGPDSGAFLDENTVVHETISDPLRTSRTTIASVPGPGIYYVHLGAVNAAFCPTRDAPTCRDEFSNTVAIDVPPRAPTLTSVGQTARHITATWTTPGDMQNDFIYISTVPDAPPEYWYWGDQLADNPVVLLDLLRWDQFSYRTADALPPGRYYVRMAAAFLVSCKSSGCDEAFSQTVPIDVADPPPAPPATEPDRVTAFASLSVRKHQDVDRLLVRAEMGEAGAIIVSGTVSAPNLSKVYKLKTVSATATPGKLVELRLKLGKKGLKAAKRALRRHRRVSASLTITARDAAGNVATQRRTIRLTN
jgi:hypothetical protein